MHGYDWVALREQYKPLLQYVAHRSDLNYVISEMISELTIQHAYIEGGDFQIPPRPRGGLPGARFELDKQAGRYRISKIFEGENEEDIYRSPLTEIGVNVNVGDYVLAIDGEELKGTDDPYRLLRNKADNPVSLDGQQDAFDAGRAHCFLSSDHRRSKPDLSRLGRSATGARWSRQPAGASATFTFPTWAPTAFASSSSGTTRRFARKV